MIASAENLQPDIAPPQPLGVLGLSLKDFESICKDLNVAPLHAKNVFRLFYKHRRLDLDATTRFQFPSSLPLYLKTTIEDVHINSCNINLKAIHRSGYDDSLKFIWKLHDGLEVESVLMPEKFRLTACVSSQVGCAQGCVFCHTGRMGLKRNLETWEIIAQLWLMEGWIKENPHWLARNNLATILRPSNVVFMGMGEPLDNVFNVVKAIEIMTEPFGMALGLRHISVSTAGHLDGLKVLLEKIPDVRLALSVHEPRSKERARLMPIEKRWPIEELVAYLKMQPYVQRHGVLVQYTMIPGVNDSKDHAQQLLALLNGLNAKINIIPFNEIAPSRFASPNAESIKAFQLALISGGRRALIRYSKGQDIAAACGQLVAASY